jgi:hypothetical protein
MRGKVLFGWVAISILAGCGSSKSVSTSAPASTTAPTATTTAPSVTAAGSATTATSAAAAAPAPTTAAGATPKLTGAADNDFCRYLVDLGDAPSTDDLDTPEAQTPEQLKQAMTEMQTVYGEMAKRAPAEIKQGLTTLSADVTRLAAIYASVGYNVVKLQEQLADPISQASVEFGKMASADQVAEGEKVDAYITNVCGLKA